MPIRQSAQGFLPLSGGTLTGNLSLSSAVTIDWNSDLLLGRAAAASLRLGAVDAAAPVAQTLSVQSVVGGTSNTAGADWTFNGSRGTGTGVGGGIIFQTAPATTTGSTQNAFAIGIAINGSGGVGIGNNNAGTGTKLRITGSTGAVTDSGLFIEDSGGNTNFGVRNNGTILIGRGDVLTTATGGYPYMTSGPGAPTGVPTTLGNFVPMYIDRTNSQLYLYIGGAWKQPKTPAGAAIVTWQ